MVILGYGCDVRVPGDKEGEGEMLNYIHITYLL